MERPDLSGAGPALVLAATLLGLILLGWAPGVAVAEPDTCPTSNSGAARIALATPAADAEVSGKVEIKGRAEASGKLVQVELFVGDARRDIAYVDPPSGAADFTLVWDTAAAKPGAATLRIVACGSNPDGLTLIRGTASVAVNVKSSPPPPENKALVATRSSGTEAPEPSLVMGIVIAVPAVAGLFYAVSSRRRRM